MFYLCFIEDKVYKVQPSISDNRYPAYSMEPFYRSNLIIKMHDEKDIIKMRYKIIDVTDSLEFEKHFNQIIIPINKERGKT